MRRASPRLTLAIVALLASACLASAHEVRPAFLEVRETAPGSYDLMWKVPARGDLRLALEVELPAECRVTVPLVRRQLPGAFVDRWSVTCPGGLAGRTIAITGLAGTMTDALARFERLEGTAQVARLLPAHPSFEVESAPNGWSVAGVYFRLGVEHILLGIDHLLFVLALLVVARTRWLLVKTISAFTAAHSLTLALATLGVVHVPTAPVEAAIALSIVFVAAEILRERAGHPGLTARAPWIVAFLFGLLHGLGFAGALSEVGLPPGHIPIALLFFNVGVEAGQLLFVAAAVALAAAVRRIPFPLPRWTPLVPPYAIGSVAMYWVIERLARF